METHHGLQLHPQLRHHLDELHVRRPVVLAGSLPLDDSPPNIHHHTLHPRPLEPHEIPSEDLRLP
eukprot:752336-Hanusia_phi.AAC.4